MDKNRSRQAFSLMELLVVIVILGLLASLVLPSLTSKGDEAKVKITCIEMKSITQALKMYKIDTSIYPETSDGLSLLATKGFFEDKSVPKDPWKNEYIYTKNGSTFDILSLGPNKIEGGDDDILYSACNK
jgi:general secretion pathway protein G